jgi:hypothetical protein
MVREYSGFADPGLSAAVSTTQKTIRPIAERKPRRIGKHNATAYRPSAPRFSPYRDGPITPTDLFAQSPYPPFARRLKLKRMRNAFSDGLLSAVALGRSVRPGQGTAFQTLHHPSGFQPALQTSLERRNIAIPHAPQFLCGQRSLVAYRTVDQNRSSKL